MEENFIMKIHLSMFSFLTLCLFSCGKDGSPEPESSDLYPINFYVTGFDKVVVDGKNTDFSPSEGESIGDYMRYLHYYIYDSGGNLVKNINQGNENADFGNISDKVKAGTYTVAFIGSTNDDPVGSTAYLSTVRVISSGVDDELYFKKITITVGKDDVEENVKLDRVTSFLQLKLLEVLPAEVARVDFTVVNDYSNFQISSESVITSGTKCEKKVSKTLANESERTNVTFNLSILNDVAPLTVSIGCFNEKGVSVKALGIQNVQCVRNKTTILSGKLFTNPSAGFKIGVNAERDPVPIEISF